MMYFMLQGEVLVNQFFLLSFNRWGELVFETRDVYVGWNGAYYGELFAEGVYVWKIEADVNGYYLLL